MTAALKVLPRNGFAPNNDAIVKNLEDFIESIRTNDLGDIRTVVLTVETTDGELDYFVLGSQCDTARAVGLLQMVSFKVITA